MDVEDTLYSENTCLIKEKKRGEGKREKETEKTCFRSSLRFLGNVIGLANTVCSLETTLHPPTPHILYVPPGTGLNKAEASDRGRWTMSAACRVL